MIHVFSGSDSVAKKKALTELINSHPDRTILYFDAESFDQDTFLGALAGADMFSAQYLVVLKDILTDEDLGTSEKVPQMADSETVFAIVEESLLKAETELLKPCAKTWKVMDLPKGREEKFNIFSITDAFGGRDKKSTWVLLQKAIRSGIAPEEVLNILIWQAKNLLLAKREPDVKKTGLSPFVYEKARKYSTNYTLSELENMSRNLVTLFHESHLGLEAGSNLERFLLKSL